MATQQIKFERRKIKGYCRYAVSNDGRVWSRAMNGHNNYLNTKWREIKAHVQKEGHLRIRICKMGSAQRKKVLVHRLVLETFIGPCPPKMECRHLNGIPADNRLTNLCWGTRKENQADSKRHGTWSHGERNAKAKLNESEVREVYRKCNLEGQSHSSVARQLGLVPTTVRSICHGITWRHLNLVNEFKKH